MNFVFHPEGFVQQLPKMGIGMLGVFLIVGVIMAATYLIARLTGHRSDDQE